MARYSVNLLPAQKEFFEIPDSVKPRQTDVAIYQGGYGSGKTWVGALIGVTMMLKYPGIEGLVGAYTYSLVRDTTLQKYFEHLDGLGIKYTYNKQEAILTLANGSKAYFRHFDDDENYKSLTVGFAEIEEASQIPRHAFEGLFGRVRQPVKPEWGDNFRYRIFGHTNPQGNKGWIYELFKKKPRKNYRRVIAPTTDNIHLPDDFVENLKTIYDESTYTMNVLGEDDNNTNNLIVKGFDYNSQVREDIDINPKFPIHLTCDFNVDPMCWYICQNYNDTTYVLYEVVIENTTTDAAAAHVAELLYKYKNHRIIINGDASGNSITTKGVDYIAMKNRLYDSGYKYLELELARKNPSIEWRINCFNRRMKAPDGTHKILIHPQCIKLIYNFENLELKPGTNKPKLPSAKQIEKDNRLKYLGHPLDAVSYLVCYYYPIEDETPWEAYQDNEDKPTDIFGGKYDKRLI